MIDFRQAHFVGIGGIGMSGIARVLLQMGYSVSGSDLEASRITRELEKLGARICQGHAPENIRGADVLVVSSAVPADNAELLAAQEAGLTIMQRGQMLSHLMQERLGVAVAGTHGKTTTTSMVATVLEHNGLQPTVIIGGELNDIGSNAKLGTGRHLVAEADESDASFLDLSPRIAVVTSVDPDVNLSTSAFCGCGYDYERTRKLVEELFFQFMHRVPEDGRVILCHDHPRIRALVPQVQRPVLTYGLGKGADLVATGIELADYGSRSRVFLRGRELGELVLRVPGRHNVQNALAAVAIGMEVGLDFPAIARVLASFQGVRRRFQVIGTFNGITVVDDYAHNPSKVQAAIQAARTGGANRVFAVFQPHRYSRVRFLAEYFFSAFEEADYLLMTDIYSAGENPIPGITTELLLDGVRRHGRPTPTQVFYTPGHQEVGQTLARECRPGDVVLCLGAGDIGECARDLKDHLLNPALR